MEVLTLNAFSCGRVSIFHNEYISELILFFLDAKPQQTNEEYNSYT
jgi:hypothetical protein